MNPEPPITLSDFLQTVAANEGEVLPTLTGRATFTVTSHGDGVRFTPTSSGSKRTVNAEGLQEYLDVFNATRSTKTTSYNQSMFNPSYVLPVILLWLGQQKTLLPPAFEETIDDIERDESFSVEDGILKVRSHLSRERNRELVRLAKDAFQFAHKGKLFCEVCGFDFGPVYGAPDFIEAHHRVPLRDLQPGTLTKISDLAMVCANCHRMLHRGPQWMTITELRTKMRRLVEKQSPELGHV